MPASSTPTPAPSPRRARRRRRPPFPPPRPVQPPRARARTRSRAMPTAATTSCPACSATTTPRFGAYPRRSRRAWRPGGVTRGVHWVKRRPAAPAASSCPSSPSRAPPLAVSPVVKRGETKRCPKRRDGRASFHKKLWLFARLTRAIWFPPVKNRRVKRYVSCGCWISADPRKAPHLQRLKVTA